MASLAHPHSEDEHPGTGAGPEPGPLPFRLDETNFRALEFLVRDGIKAIPRQGLEVGGLVVLLEGEAENGDDLAPESQLEFVPIEITHQFGPRFRIADADKPIIENAFAGYSSKKQHQIIGCYRSHLNADAKIRTEDIDLLQIVFGESGGLLLMVEASTSRPSVVHVYRRGRNLDLRLVEKFPIFPLRAGPSFGMETPAAPPPASTPPVSATPLPMPHASTQSVPPPPIEAAPKPQDSHPKRQPSMAERKNSVVAAFGGIETAAEPRLPGPNYNIAQRPGDELSLAGESSKRNRTLITIAVVAGVGVLGLVAGRFTAFPGRPKEDPVAFAVNVNDGKAALSWNAASPTVKNAVRGSMLVIDDSGVRRVELNASQLREGKYAMDVRGRVTYQITFYGRDDSFTGETKNFDSGLHDMALNHDAAANPAAPVSPAPAVSAPASNSGATGTASLSSKPTKPAATPGNAGLPTPAESTSQRVKPLAVVSIPAGGSIGVSQPLPPATNTARTQQPIKAPNAVLREAPSLPEQVLTAPPAQTETASRTAPPPERTAAATRQASAPTVEAVPPPVTSSQGNRSQVALPDILPGGRTPLPRVAPPPIATSPSALPQTLRGPLAVTFVAPVPVKQVPPAIPANVRASLRESTTIEVTVTVNDQGKVVAAVPVKKSGGIEKMLGPYAVQAAKLWQFTPAKRDGQPVLGEAVVAFRFVK